jgi:hypothetical protein
MVLKLEDLLDRAMELPAADRERLAQLLLDGTGSQVRDSDATYRTPKGPTAMTRVTIVLSDDLAEQAQAAGLLAANAMEDLLRRALVEQNAAGSSSKGPTRRLLRERGRLVVEALPGEPPVTDADVRRLLNEMEW